MVYISLSERGRRAYEHHARFHRAMIEGVTGELSQGELKTLVKALSKLEHWFYSRKN